MLFETHSHAAKVIIPLYIIHCQAFFTYFIFILQLILFLTASYLNIAIQIILHSANQVPCQIEDTFPVQAIAFNSVIFPYIKAASTVILKERPMIPHTLIPSVFDAYIALDEALYSIKLSSIVIFLCIGLSGFGASTVTHTRMYPLYVRAPAPRSQA